MKLINAAYGSTDVALKRRAYFEMYGLIYKWDINVDIFFSLMNEKKLHLVKNKYDILICDKYGENFYTLDGKCFNRGEADNKFNLFNKFHHKEKKEVGSNLITLNDENIIIPKTARVIRSSNNYLIYKFNDVLFLLSEKLVEVRTIDLRMYSYTIIDENIYVYNLQYNKIYLIEISNGIGEEIELEGIVFDQEIFVRKINKVGEMNGDEIFKVFDHLYVKSIDNQFKKIDLCINKKVNSVIAKQNVLYVIYFFDLNLYAFDSEFELYGDPYSLPRSIDSFSDFSFEEGANVCRFVNHADFSRVYIAKWNDEEVINGNRMIFEYEKELFNIEFEYCKSKEKGNAIITVSDNISYGDFIRHAISGYSEFVWSTCFDLGCDKFLNKQLNTYSGLCIIRYKKDIFNHNENSKIKEIVSGVNRRMMIQKIKGTDITPSLEIELI